MKAIVTKDKWSQRKTASTPIKKDPQKKQDGSQQDADAGEISFGRTIGRHGTDNARDLNPEE